MTDRRDERREQQLALYLEGKLSPEDAARLEQEVLRDESLSEELYSQLQLRDALTPAAAGRSVAPTRRSPAPRRRVAPALAAVLVASLALVMVLLPRFREGDAPTERVLRGEGATVELLEATRTDGSLRLRWSSDPQARRYRVELLDAGGMVLQSLLHADTLLVLDPAPDPVATRWRVVPLDAVGAALPSPPAGTLR